MQWLFRLKKQQRPESSKKKDDKIIKNGQSHHFKRNQNDVTDFFSEIVVLYLGKYEKNVNFFKED